MIEAFGKLYDSEDAFAFSLYSEGMRSYDLNNPTDPGHRHPFSELVRSLSLLIAAEVFAGKLNAEDEMAFFQDLFSK